MVKIAHLNDAFSEIFELEENPEEAESLWHKDKKGGKGQAKRIKNLKSLKT